jgi:YVTN family beta-propeller protein
VWVLNTGGRSISRLDDGTGDVIGTVPLAGGPVRAKADAAAGRVYVLLEENGLAVIDIRTGEVQTTLDIPTASRPTSFVALPWRNELCVCTYGGGLHVLDTATLNWTASTPTGDGSLWGTPQVASYGKLHIVNELSNDVTVIDEQSKSVITTIPVGRRPVRNITYPRYNTVNVANWDDGSVSVIDIASDEVVATIPVGVHPGRMAVTQKGTGRDTMWVLNRGSEQDPRGAVSVVDGAVNEVVRTIEVCHQPFQWKFEEPYVYVVSGSAREITILDERTASVVGSTKLVRDPDLAADNVLKGGRRGIFLVNSDDSLTVYGPSD